MWGFEHYGVVPDIVTWAKGMSAGMPVCGTVTTREIAQRAAGTRGLPWAGTYSSDPLPAAVALKQLQIVIRDGLVAHAAGLGETLQSGLAALQQRHECIGGRARERASTGCSTSWPIPRPARRTRRWPSASAATRWPRDW